MATFRMKQGDTFSFYANVTDANGLPVINAVANIKSQIVTNKSVLVAEFVITTTAVDGQYLFKVADTSSFPADTIVFTDIQYTDVDVISSSETMTIAIVKDVTM